MSKVGIIIFSAIFLFLNLFPDQVFSFSGKSQLELRATVLPVFFFSQEENNQFSGVTNSDFKLMILEKTAEGQTFYYPGSQKISPRPLSTYTLISEI